MESVYQQSSLRHQFIHQQRFIQSSPVRDLHLTKRHNLLQIIKFKSFECAKERKEEKSCFYVALNMKPLSFPWARFGTQTLLVILTIIICLDSM